MKKLKSRNWKDEINALLISRHIKKIRQMSISYLRGLLKEAMDIGYGFQQEENLTKPDNNFVQECSNPDCEFSENYVCKGAKVHFETCIDRCTTKIKSHHYAQ